MLSSALWLGACSLSFDDAGLAGGANAQDGGQDARDASVFDGGSEASGATQPAIVASAEATPHWMVLDTNAVFWVNEGAVQDGGGKSSEVVRYDRTDQTKRTLVAAIPTGSELAQDASSLFWIEGSGGCVADCGAGTVTRLVP